MKVMELCGDKSWELKYSGFKIAGSKIVWESATYSYRTDKVVVSRVVNRGGRPFVLGLGHISRYVTKHILVTSLIPRKD